MALFLHVAKLGSEAYGARHARARPSVMQCVLAVRETVPAEQVKYHGTRPLSVLYTHLSLNRERSHSIYA